MGFSVDRNNFDVVCFPAHNAARLGFTIACGNRDIATQSLYEVTGILPVDREDVLAPFLGHWFVVVEEEGEWFFHRGKYVCFRFNCQSIFAFYFHRL